MRLVLVFREAEKKDVFVIPRSVGKKDECEEGREFVTMKEKKYSQ